MSMVPNRRLPNRRVVAVSLASTASPLAYREVAGSRVFTARRSARRRRATYGLLMFGSDRPITLTIGSRAAWRTASRRAGNRRRGDRHDQPHRWIGLQNRLRSRQTPCRDRRRLGRIVGERQVRGWRRATRCLMNAIHSFWLAARQRSGDDRRSRRCRRAGAPLRRSACCRCLPASA